MTKLLLLIVSTVALIVLALIALVLQFGWIVTVLWVLGWALLCGLLPD